MTETGSPPYQPRKLLASLSSRPHQQQQHPESKSTAEHQEETPPKLQQQQQQRRRRPVLQQFPPFASTSSNSKAAAARRTGNERALAARREILSSRSSLLASPPQSRSVPQTIVLPQQGSGELETTPLIVRTSPSLSSGKNRSNTNPKEDVDSLASQEPSVEKDQATETTVLDLSVQGQAMTPSPGPKKPKDNYVVLALSDSLATLTASCLDQILVIQIQAADAPKAIPPSPTKALMFQEDACPDSNSSNSCQTNRMGTTSESQARTLDTNQAVKKASTGSTPDVSDTVNVAEPNKNNSMTVSEEERLDAAYASAVLAACNGSKNTQETTCFVASGSNDASNVCLEAKNMLFAQGPNRKEPPLVSQTTIPEEKAESNDAVLKVLPSTSQGPMKSTEDDVGTTFGEAELSSSARDTQSLADEKPKAPTDASTNKEQPSTGASSSINRRQLQPLLDMFEPGASLFYDDGGEEKKDGSQELRPELMEVMDEECHFDEVPRMISFSNDAASNLFHLCPGRSKAEETKTGLVHKMEDKERQDNRNVVVQSTLKPAKRGADSTLHSLSGPAVDSSFQSFVDGSIEEWTTPLNESNVSQTTVSCKENRVSPVQHQDTIGTSMFQVNVLEESGGHEAFLTDIEVAVQDVPIQVKQTENLVAMPQVTSDIQHELEITTQDEASAGTEAGNVPVAPQSPSDIQQKREDAEEEDTESSPEREKIVTRQKEPLLEHDLDGNLQMILHDVARSQDADDQDASSSSTSQEEDETEGRNQAETTSLVKRDIHLEQESFKSVTRPLEERAQPDISKRDPSIGSGDASLNQQLDDTSEIDQLVRNASVSMDEDEQSSTGHEPSTIKDVASLLSSGSSASSMESQEDDDDDENHSSSTFDQPSTIKDVASLLSSSTSESEDEEVDDLSSVDSNDIGQWLERLGKGTPEGQNKEEEEEEEDEKADASVESVESDADARAYEETRLKPMSLPLAQMPAVSVSFRSPKASRAMAELFQIPDHALLKLGSDSQTSTLHLNNDPCTSNDVGCSLQDAESAMRPHPICLFDNGRGEAGFLIHQSPVMERQQANVSQAPMVHCWGGLPERLADRLYVASLRHSDLVYLATGPADQYYAKLASGEVWWGSPCTTANEEADTVNHNAFLHVCEAWNDVERVAFGPLATYLDDELYQENESGEVVHDVSKQCSWILVNRRGQAAWQNIPIRLERQLMDKGLVNSAPSLVGAWRAMGCISENESARETSTAITLQGNTTGELPNEATQTTLPSVVPERGEQDDERGEKSDERGEQVEEGERENTRQAANDAPVGVTQPEDNFPMDQPCGECNSNRIVSVSLGPEDTYFVRFGDGTVDYCLCARAAQACHELQEKGMQQDKDDGDDDPGRLKLLEFALHPQLWDTDYVLQSQWIRPSTTTTALVEGDHAYS